MSSRLTVSDHIDMEHRIVIQIRDNLFALLDGGLSLWKLTNLIDGKISKEDLAIPLKSRKDPSVTTFNQRFLFVTGGIGLNNVDYYDTAVNQWTHAPAMMAERSSHSSCCLKGKLYVFGGEDRDGTKY